MATTQPLRFNPFQELERLTADLLPRLAPQAFSPRTDVVERDGSIQIRMDVPGVPREGLTIEIVDGKLVVSGERTDEAALENDRHWQFERQFGAFTRTFTLPRGVTEEHIAATSKDGVLTVSVTLPSKPEPTRITIS